MGDTMKVALTFTAVDAASSYIAGLERRIDALGAAGKKMRGEFDSMQSHFANGLKGFGVAYSTMQFMRPGITAAAAMESSGLAVQNSLAAAGKSTAAMSAEYKSMRSTALFLSAHSPFEAPAIMRAQKLLLDSGFNPGEISGKSGLASSVVGMSQLSGQSLEAVREMGEIFDQQFGGGSAGVSAAFDWISQSGMEDKLPELAAGLTSMGTRASAMNIPVKDAITTIGLLEHVSRRSGGAIGAFLKSTRPDATSSQAVRMRDLGINFYDKKGTFIGMESAQNMLKQRFGGIQGDRIKMLESVFGEGAIGAEGLIKGDNLAQVRLRYEQNLKLMQKVDNLNKGLTQSYEQLVFAGKNALGSVFAPMTSFLAARARNGGAVFESLGRFSEKHEGISKGLAITGMGAVLGAAAYGAFNMGKAGLLLKSIAGNIGSTSGGILAGKAAEMAGVTSVFVVNWPASMGGVAGAAGSVLDGAAGAVTAGAITKAGLGMFMLKGSLLGASLAAGWTFGKWVDKNAQTGFDAVNFHPVDKLGDIFSDYAESHAAGKIPNKVIINMSIDENKKITASGSLDTDFEVNNRGSFHVR